MSYGPRRAEPERMKPASSAAVGHVHLSRVGHVNHCDEHYVKIKKQTN